MASVRQFFTVDLRGLRPALAARAAERGQTESDVLRAVLASELRVDDEPFKLTSTDWTPVRPVKLRRTNLSVRLASASANRMDSNARAAGLSRGAYLAGLIDAAPAVVTSTERMEAIASLKLSCAEMAVLSRDVRNLTRLLRAGSTEAADSYRACIEGLDGAVRTHLTKVATVLATLPAGRSQREPVPSSTLGSRR